MRDGRPGSPDRIEALESKLDALLNEVESLRREIRR